MNDEKPNQRCPLCGQTNHCAIAGGQPAADCWCMHARIEPPARQQAAELDGGAERCLCPSCGRGGYSSASTIAS